MNKNMTLAGPNPEETKSLFGSIADNYDLANDVITLGLVRNWRRQLVKWSEVRLGDKVLDCATGTGALAVEFKRVVGRSGQVIGADFCAEMLERAPAKTRTGRFEVQLDLADAMNLPYNDATFDAVSMGYGIRSVADPLKVIAEMARVCKVGGRVLILELGPASRPLFNSALQFYMRNVVPHLGGWVTGHPQVYAQLNSSPAQFPTRERFVDLMKETKMFRSCYYKSLMAGASFIYKGVRSP